MFTTTTTSAIKGTKSWSRTRFLKYHLEHTWSIEEFSLLLSHQTSPLETYEKYFFITSASFSPPENDQIQLVIKLFPCGDKEENRDSVGLFLCLKKYEKEAVKIKYTFSILMANGKVFRSLHAKVNFSEKIGYGWFEFIKRADLLNNAAVALPGDILTIRCEADVIYKQDVESGLDTSERMQQLAGECANQLAQDLSSFHISGENSDVILVVDGKEFTAHKLILSARSSVFKAMFANDCKEKKEGKVDITDVDLEAFEEFLRFLYTGKVVLGENALELMEVADKYDTETLKVLCEEYLSSKLAIDTVVPILVKADMHSAKDLKSKAIQFLISHVSTLVEIENWDASLEARPKLYSEVISQIGKASKPKKAAKPKKIQSQ